MKNVPIIFLMIILLGLGLRLWRINIPLLEFYPSRQVQTAEVTRNLYREGFNLLTPTVHYLGPGPGTFLVEFPLYNWVVASIYKLTGGVDEIWGRLFSVAGWLASFYFLWHLAKKYAGPVGALAAVFFYTLSPLSVLVSRSFQPDQWMLTLSISAIYFIIKWKENQKVWLVIVSLVYASCAFLLKTQSVIFTILPISFVILTSNVSRSKFLFIFYVLLASLPVALWTVFAAIQNRATPGTSEIFSLSNYFGWDIFLNPKYYSNIFGYEYNLVLLPVGLFLFLAGLATKLAKGQYFLYWWLGAVIVYFLIFNKLNMVHEYYHLPFLPIAAIFIGIGCEKLITNFKNLFIPKTTLIFIFSILIFTLMLPPTLARAYKPIERFKYVPETAQAIQRLTRPEDLIIGSMDAGPTLVYYADRVGWTLKVNRSKTARTFAFYGIKNKQVKDPIADLEDLKSKGATIFASASKGQFLENETFAKYMYKNYKTLEETKYYIIFDLKK